MKTVNDSTIILSIQKILFLVILNLAFFSCSKDDNDGDSNSNFTVEFKGIFDDLGAGAGVATLYGQQILLLVKDENGKLVTDRKFMLAVDEGSLIKFYSYNSESYRTGESYSNYEGLIRIVWTPGKTVGKQIIKITPFDIDGKTLLKNSTTNVAINVKPGIGTFYKGGVIFYLDKTLDHGFVCAVSDQSPAQGTVWACDGFSILDPYSPHYRLGDGITNTLALASSCSTSGSGSAVNLCANLVLNGYDDWFLPSKDEIYQMFRYYRIIDETAIENKGSTFKKPDYLTNGYYFSSTFNEVENIDLDGERANLWGGFTKNKYHVRAIRAF